MRKLMLKRPRPFKNLNAPYRMVFINEDSLEEVGSFHLTKRSVWTLFSTLFVVTILVTVSILLFTPLKYYIPGYGSNVARTQVIQLKQSVDSLSDLVVLQQKQWLAIRSIISGDDPGIRDTAMLKLELADPSGAASILPKAEEIRGQAVQEIKKEKKKVKRRG
jgi:hypothetical protein